MEIVKNNLKIKCDFPGCKNLATFCLCCTDNKKHNVHLCQSCVKELNTKLSKVLTPKSIKNVYQKGGLNGKE